MLGARTSRIYCHHLIPHRAEDALPVRRRHKLVVTILSRKKRVTKLGAASPRTGTRVGDTCPAEASEREDSLAAALSLYHPRDAKLEGTTGLALPAGPHSPQRSFAWLAPQQSGGQPVPRVPRDPGRQEIRRCHRGLRAAPAAAPSTNPGRQQVAPAAPFRRQGLRCGREGRRELRPTA